MELQRYRKSKQQLNNTECTKDHISKDIELSSDGLACLVFVSPANDRKFALAALASAFATFSHAQKLRLEPQKLLRDLKIIQNGLAITLGRIDNN